MHPIEIADRKTTGARSRCKVEFDGPAWQCARLMTAKEVLERVAAMPAADWMEIQSGIAEMLAARFSAGEISEVRDALAEAEFARGEGVSGDEMRRHFGLR